MFEKLLSWARRHSRRAIALAMLPGLVLLGGDAAIAHFMGTENDLPLQYVPVIYAVAAIVLLLIAVVPRSRAFFSWTARICGGAGVIVGLVGLVYHLLALKSALEGDYSWANLQGTINNCPPLGAPLGFTGLGALIFFLPSTRLLLRLKVGKPVAKPATKPKLPPVKLDPAA